MEVPLAPRFVRRAVIPGRRGDRVHDAQLFKSVFETLLQEILADVAIWSSRFQVVFADVLATDQYDAPPVYASYRLNGVLYARGRDPYFRTVRFNIL